MPITRPCNICSLKGVSREATHDAKTLAGPWAYVCDEHLKTACSSNPKLRTKLSEVK